MRSLPILTFHTLLNIDFGTRNFLAYLGAQDTRLRKRPDRVICEEAYA